MGHKPASRGDLHGQNRLCRAGQRGISELTARRGPGSEPCSPAEKESRRLPASDLRAGTQTNRPVLTAHRSPTHQRTWGIRLPAHTALTGQCEPVT